MIFFFQNFHFPVLENNNIALRMIMTFKAKWGILESHCTVIISNESIVYRVSFLGTVEIFQTALCLSELTVWQRGSGFSYGVTLNWLSRCGSPSNELMFHPVSYHSSAVPQDARSTKTHAAARVHGNNRNKHENNKRAVSVVIWPNTPPVLSFQLSWPDSLQLSATCLTETLKAFIFNNWFEVALLRSTFRVDSLSDDAGASKNS